MKNLTTVLIPSILLSKLQPSSKHNKICKNYYLMSGILFHMNGTLIF